MYNDEVLEAYIAEHGEQPEQPYVRLSWDLGIHFWRECWPVAQAAAKCPHIASDPEGTSYCRLAQSTPSAEAHPQLTGLGKLAKEISDRFPFSTPSGGGSCDRDLAIRFLSLIPSNCDATDRAARIVGMCRQHFTVQVGEKNNESE